MKPESGDVSHLDLAGRMRPPDPKRAASLAPMLCRTRTFALAIMADCTSPTELLAIFLL